MPVRVVMFDGGDWYEVAIKGKTIYQSHSQHDAELFAAGYARGLAYAYNAFGVCVELYTMGTREVFAEFRE